MFNNEPKLEEIEDYNNNENSEKRLTIWVVILSGLLIGSIYVIISMNTSMSDLLVERETTGIIKY